MRLEGVRGLSLRVSLALTSFNVLFERPASDGSREIGSFNEACFLKSLRSTLLAMRRDVASLADDASSAKRLTETLSGEADSIDMLNALSPLCAGSPFQSRLEACLSETLGQFRECRGLDDPQTPEGHAMFHARNIAEALETLIPDYISLLESMSGSRCGGASRLNPAARSLSSSRLQADALERLAAGGDSLDSGRVFRHMDGEFIPVELASIRKVGDFYGYPEARRKFMECFSDFSSGKSNLPLLISSLPGLGKTHFTISHALHFDNISLILPEPRDLEKPLESIIDRLSKRRDRKFVLFFDDVDTRRIDWYHFRTNIGGSFSLPENIAVAIASNFQFPANISSRGRGFVFPSFDEVRCQEMVADFLLSLGMKSPRPELASVIAADYVEEFGQKVFEELSPRTLVRYLGRYMGDASRRKRMLDVSKGDLIPKPDSQVFFDVNAKLIKSLYGEDALNELKPQPGVR